MTHVNKLKELLTRSVEKSCKPGPRIGIIFSGGIDSTIIAMLACKFSHVTAYCCGIENSPDREYVNDCRDLGFEIKVIGLTSEKIEKSLPHVIWAISDTSPVKVSVEIPFHFASKKAKEDGLDVMLCGQGADEMFGGYNRYLAPLPDYKTVEEMMKEDVENTYLRQIDKDARVCRANGIELRAPYMEDEFKNYVSEIPTELKLREVKDLGEFACVDVVDGGRFIRKYILRKLGEELGVPGPILNRKKKAAQYGSGTWKVLNRIARQRGFREKARNAGRKDYVGMFLESIRDGIKPTSLYGHLHLHPASSSSMPNQ